MAQYEYMTEKKYQSLGEIMTIKQACDLWWNSVNIRYKDKTFICYKYRNGYDGIEDIMDEFDITKKEALNMLIKLNDDYWDDSDGYPIIYARFTNDEEEN